MPNQFLSPEGDLENYFVSEYWLIDQWIGDELWTWGYNGIGQLAINDTTSRSTPVTTFAGGTNWSQISAGNNHSLALKTDGTLWTWGNNANGQLGDNTITNKLTPITTFAGGTDWKQVSCGRGHSSAIKTDGTLWTWGNNSQAQLGINEGGTTTNRTTPVTTFAGGTNWKQVSCGTFYTGAIKTDGTLWTWGRNDIGQLGINSTLNASTPVTTFAGGTNWNEVSCGYAFASAIKTDGTLWIWGSNLRAHLGINDTIDRLTPVTTFAGGTNWKQVSCGAEFPAAIKTDGTLWIWGYNSVGQLGINDSGAAASNRSTPVTTFAGGTNWKRVNCSYGSVASAIKTDGTLWVWGNNAVGMLGVNNTTNRLTPVTTSAGGTNWKQSSGGFLFVAAVTSGIPANLPLS
jgi:alpha-tubulin suppressor-like RCC1 family protein